MKIQLNKENDQRFVVIVIFYDLVNFSYTDYPEQLGQIQLQMALCITYMLRWK